MERSDLTFDGHWGGWSDWTKPCHGNNINAAQIQIYETSPLLTENVFDDKRGATNVRLFCRDGSIHQKKDKDPSR